MHGSKSGRSIINWANWAPDMRPPTMKKDLAADRADQFRTEGATCNHRVSDSHPTTSNCDAPVTPLINPYILITN